MMTARQLIEALSEVPGDARVVVEVFNNATGKAVGEYVVSYYEPWQSFSTDGYDHSKPADSIVLSCTDEDET